MSKKENAIKVLETAVKVADDICREKAYEIFVVSSIGLLSAAAATILKKGGNKKES